MREAKLPALQETRVPSLGQEDPLEKEMATHSSILAWRIPWMEEPGGLQSMGLQGIEYDQSTDTSLHICSNIYISFKYVCVCVCVYILKLYISSIVLSIRTVRPNKIWPC